MCSTQFTFRLFSSRLPLNNGYRCRYFSRCNPHNVSATTSLHKTFEPDYLDVSSAHFSVMTAHHENRSPGRQTSSGKVQTRQHSDERAQLRSPRKIPEIRA